ncbi:MAG: hypothetical protein A2W91_13085 [Bacteroidetes bacterium GWF2_38_335]|nr:MAG: hypothetical protein A2W91_13085 [Bacteroidetes bacterium GWF2_38_335]OFY77190.1 MAG: hypothetical protein A2281_14750 [Bacteroidetes bacterium RIFOXYA12_FULL_38_20]HBS85810.1 hypothetical protein [Bacteroidales bacterium]
MKMKFILYVFLFAILFYCCNENKNTISKLNNNIKQSVLYFNFGIFENYPKIDSFLVIKYSFFLSKFNQKHLDIKTKKKEQVFRFLICSDFQRISLFYIEKCSQYYRFNFYEIVDNIYESNIINIEKKINIVSIDDNTSNNLNIIEKLDSVFLLMNEMNFWNLKSIFPISYLDGATKILIEGKTIDKYHAINRLSPLEVDFNGSTELLKVLKILSSLVSYKLNNICYGIESIQNLSAPVPKKINQD